ncbi:MAG: histidine kinase [Planctomycetes bacterium]|nr:histidine kinase [Planctomycetota bacterium]
MSEARGTGLERLLTSWRGRALLTVALAALVSLVTTAPHLESADLRGRDVDLVEIYFEQLAIWGAWFLLLWPLTVASEWVLRRTRSWALFFAVMVPISLGASYGFLYLDYLVHRPTEAEREAWREEARRRRPDRFQPPEFGPEGQLPPPGPLDGPPPDDLEARRARQRAADRAGARRWGALRVVFEGPDLDYVHWRLRWIQNALLFWAMLGLGGGLAAFLRLRREERVAAELELRASELRGELAAAHLEALRGQLQPHFLFNSLHSVGGLIRAGQAREALTTLSALGELLRSTLDLDGDAELKLEDELAIARRYLEIEGIRFGDRLRVEVEVEPGLGDALIPTLLLLPLVENAVKYGVAPRLDGGTVHVEARRVGGELELVVRDDGEGFPPDVLSGATAPSGRRAIGLENTRGRLRALYGAAQRFDATNPPEGGARVSVRLPYHVTPLPRRHADE